MQDTLETPHPSITEEAIYAEFFGPALSNDPARQERYRTSFRKWKRARRVSAVLARLPFVRGVFVCNSLSFDASRDESDIDLFIIGTAGHVWLARLFILGCLSLARLRPGERKTRADSICTCFFASTSALDLSSFALPIKRGIPDVYLLAWIAHCIPVYDDGVYEEFVRANEWTRTWIPEWRRRGPSRARQVRLSSFERAMKKICEIVFNALAVEQFCRHIQEKKISQILRTAAAAGDPGAVITDHVIKLHYPNDRRMEFQNRFAADRQVPI